MFFIAFDSPMGSARFHTLAGGRFAVARTWEAAYPFATRAEAEATARDARIPTPHAVLSRDEAVARMARDDD